MHISCLPVSFYRAADRNEISVTDWFKMAKLINVLDGADLGITMIKNHAPSYLTKLNKELKEIGLPLVMITTYPDFTHPDPLQRAREAAYSAADIAVASQLGAKYVRIVAGQAHPAVSRENGIKWAIEGILESQRVAKEFGVRLVYENHPGARAWNYEDFSFSIDRFLEIYDGIRGSGVGINFDIFDVTANGADPFDLLPKIIDMVETVHVNDTAEKGVMKAVPLGQGACPIQEIFTYLKQHDFNGWLCIEEYTERGLNGVVEAVNFVKEAWDKA